MRGAVVVADDRLVRRAGDFERFVDALTHGDGRVCADAKGPKNLYSEDVEAMGLFGVVISRMEEARIKELRAERGRREVLATRAHVAEDVRKRWKGLELSQKRALLFESLHAVIVHPAGKGRKPFNPDLLEPRWKS